MSDSKGKPVKNVDHCNVIGRTNIGKSGKVEDVNISKTGHMTITVRQKDDVRFKTLAKNVEII
ncbi:RNA-binding protein [uncultured Chryseobacterium sp.]|uniref:RNA-binding protein n=1 Tax=uncultured Chryseobacterium sp. TaxID=259322 RepID=UPI00262E2B28|nr:RNA-binding protein [uncultured Chryseobacterium sp.]